MLAVLPLITSRHNTRVRALRSALLHPPQPGSGGALGIEGEHLLQEAVRSGLSLRSLFLTPAHAVPESLPSRTEIVQVTEPVFASLSQTRTPQGIAALLDAPRFHLEQALRSPALLLVAEALQDPGNLGTLIRSAEAFGATGVLLLPDQDRPSASGVNPFNSKCVRASAGSVFRVPVLPVERSTVGDLTRGGIQLLAATGRVFANDRFATADLRRPTAFLIGNEGAGLSPAALAMATAPVTIPCSGPVESLNAAVAASILLFAAQQQRRLERT